MKKYIIGIDAGTTSVRTVLYDASTNQIINIENKQFTQFFPQAGWVEHDAEEIWECVTDTLNATFKKFNLSNNEIYGIAITNQRETTAAWNKKTNQSICPAIVWQCRRTAEKCDKIRNKKEIKNKTGLIIDPYFSATKMQWLLKNNDKVKKLSAQNNLCLGTIDSFLISKFTKGKSFYTDVSNASRTMLFNINKLEWDKKLLKQFNIPLNALPVVKPCNYNYGMANTTIGDLPILGVIGDQQSSLFGQGCFNEGMAKCTFGTGCFVLMNIGKVSHIKNKKLISTIAWQIDNNITYALEGSVFSAGSAIDWAKKIGLFEDENLTSQIAENINNSNGVYFVPAFNGLGAPYWNSKARGVVCGITSATTKEHIIRAMLEGIAYSVYDIIKNMEDDKIKLSELRCDGGVSNNDFLLKFLSILINKNLKRQESVEATALGAIYIAGLNAGVYKDLDEISKIIKFKSVFKPNENENVELLIKNWHNAIKKA